MIKTQTKSLTQTYDDLKWRYFGELKHPHFYKGDVRAFVGLRTWHYECEFSKQGCLSHEAHVMALEKTLGETSFANEKVFWQLFNSTLDDWRECQKDWLEGFEQHLWPDHSLQIEPTKNGDGLTVVSLFSGALGLDLGFHQNGFEVRLANDIEPSSAEVTGDIYQKATLPQQWVARLTRLAARWDFIGVWLGMNHHRQLSLRQHRRQQSSAIPTNSDHCLSRSSNGFKVSPTHGKSPELQPCSTNLSEMPFLYTCRPQSRDTLPGF